MAGKSDLRAFLAGSGVSAEFLEFGGSVHSVADAAERAGAPHDSFVKTMALVADGSPAVAIIPGDRRLDMGKVAGILGAKGARMAKPSEVLEATGYPAGGVPPIFANPRRIPFLIDRRVLERETVLGGGGDARTLLRIRPADILRATGATEADLCPD